VEEIQTLPAVTQSVMNIAAYRFAQLTDLRTHRERLLEVSRAGELKGTILLSHEGINLFVAGAANGVEALLAGIRAIPGLHDLTVKVSYSDHQPFNRMLIRLKKEIIAFSVPGIEPARHTSPKISPQTLKEWIDAGREMILLDTRNDYEVRLGTFRGALPIGIQHFRQFPGAVRQLPPEMKKTPIVMFCTGGIRCEKAGPFNRRYWGFLERNRPRLRDNVRLAMPYRSLDNFGPERRAALLDEAEAARTMLGAVIRPG
jgi:predicted sulfurtransferase